MPPKKGNKMSLNDFLADEATGNWADDVDDLPIAPQASRYPGDSGARRGGDYLASMPDRADRPLATPYGGMSDRGPPRQDVPLPDKPPFTAFLGSLSFDVTEGDIADFFAPHNPVSIRIVADRDGKPKGFGYVEFESLDALKDALTRSGANLAGRQVRIGVAEPPRSSSDRPGFGPSVAEEASQWRRAGPLAPIPDEGPMARRGGGPGGDRGFRPNDGGPSGFDNMEVGAGGRSGFGSRFQASPAGAPGGVSPRGPPREPREPLEPSKGEVASDWRTGKPMEAPPPRRPAFQQRDGSQEGPNSARSPSFRQRDATEVDEKYASQERMGFGSKFVATPPDSPSANKRGPYERRSSAQGGPGEGADTWRSARGGSRGASGTASPSGAAGSAPAERKKLDLKPRGSSAAEGATAAAAAAGAAGTEGSSSATAASTTSSKASPFGNAKPVDSSEREKAIEERIRKERQQRAADEAARREKQQKEREQQQKQQTTETGAGAAKDAAAATGGAASSATTPTSAAPAKSSPAPTGAWGKGRAASGALATQQQPEQQAAKTNGDAETEQITKGVEDVKVSGDEKEAAKTSSDNATPAATSTSS